MFVDRVELDNLYWQKERLTNLLEDETLSEKVKEILRDELLMIEDEMNTITHNNILTR